MTSLLTSFGAMGAQCTWKRGCCYDIKRSVFSASHGTEYAGNISSREGVRLCVVISQHSASGSAAAIVRLMAILIKPIV